MGFEKANWECVYSVEWDKHKRRIYGIIFGEEPQGADISEVRADEFPHADCWTFGAPCQDFSIAGARKGLDGDRSSLIREVFRLVRETKEEYRPKWLLYENVEGMLSSNKGFDYLQILIEMESLGYNRIEYSLLNSKNFGVPQNRKRVFTLGHLRGGSSRKIFPIERNESKDIIKEINIPKEILNDNERQRRVYDIKGISPSILGRNDSPKIKINGIKKIGSVNNSQSGAIYDSSGLAVTVTGHGGGQGAKTGLYEIKSRIRRLTPKETWRLQGIDDTITDKVMAAGISDTQMYRGAGDACTVNVIYEIARRINRE